MPTFNSGATVYADQFTPAASEAWTIQSGTTVNVAGDYANSASPNPYAGVLTVTEGKIVIDGRAAYEIGVSNTTNASVGLSITGATSGATAVITQLLTSPTRIKFRSVNGVAFQNGETISGGSFSAAANTAPSRSTIQFLQNQAANILSIAKLGTLEIRGVWRQLGTSNGTANQTFTSPFSGVHPGIWLQRGGSATLTNGSSQIAITHEWEVGQIVELSTSGSLSGTGFSTGTKYYVTASDWSGLTGQFGTYVSLATTKGGSAITATGTGSGSISLLASGAVVTFANGSATITATNGHSRSNGETLTFATTGTLPTGINDADTYFVISSNQAAGTFQVCVDWNPETLTGTPITVTGTGSGTHEIVPDSNYVVWQNIVDRTLTGATALVGVDMNHGRFFKQTNGSTTLTFGDAGASAATTVASFSTTIITTSTAHGRAIGDIVQFSTTGTLSNVSVNTDYYVLTVPTSTTLTVAATANGTAINLSTSTGTVTITPQIGGRIPAYGARVRIPNVYWGVTNSANAPTPIISAFGSISTSAGTILASKCLHSGYQVSLGNCTALTLLHFTVHNQLLLSNILNPAILQDVAVSSSLADAGILISLSGVNAYATNLYGLSNSLAATAQVTSATKSQIIGGVIVQFSRSTGNNVGLNLTSTSSANISKLRVLGAQIQFSAALNCSVNNCFWSDQPSKFISLATGGSAISWANNATNCSVDQLQLGSIPRSFIINGPTGGSIIRRIGSASSPLDLQGQAAQFISLISPYQATISECYGQNDRTGYIILTANPLVLPTNFKYQLSGNYSRAQTLSGRGRNVILRGLRGSVIGFGSSDLSGVHYYDLFTSATTGIFGLVFQPKNTDDYFSNSSYTINADTNPSTIYFSANTLQLRTSGNQITYETRWIYGHSSLGTLTATSNSNANYTYQYDVDTGSGFSGSYATITSGSSLGVSVTPSTGFRLRIRITATVTSSANSISVLTIATTSTAVAQAAIAYPYQQYTQTVQGLIAGTIIGLYDDSGNLVQAGTVDSTGTFTFNPVEFFTVANYTIKYRCYRYKEGAISVTLTNGTNTQTVAQVLDTSITQSNPATVSAYAGIAINYGSQLATISASITPQQLYDFHAYDLSLIANISRTDWLTSTDGLNFTSTFNVTIASGGSFGSSAGSISITNAKTLTLAVARVYTFTFSIGSLSKVLLGAAGTFDLSVFTFTSGAKIDNSTALAATAIVSSTQIGNVTATSPTTGGGSVTITQACTITLSGILSGSSVTLFNSTSTLNSSTLVESGTASGTSYSFAAINFTGTNTYTYRVRLYGRFEVQGTVTLVSGAVTVSISQPANPFITQATVATVAAYSGVAVNHSTQSIAQTANLSRAQLYDYLQYNAALLANLAYEIPVSTSNGSDLTLTYNYTRTSAALTGTGSLSLPSKTATITGDSSTGQLPITDSSGLRYRAYGLPTASGSAPVLRAKRISTGTITNPTVNANGEAYFVIATGEDYELRADARGYEASVFVTVNSSSSSSTQFTLNRFVDSAGNPVYGNGVAGEMALISFNPSTLYITIQYSTSYPTIGPYSALDKLEQILASSAGLEFTAHPTWSNGAIRFPRDIVSGNPNPARIQPDSSNTGIPELLFESIHDGYDTPYRLFDFSNGKTINYPTSVTAAQVSVSGGFTADKADQLAALFATLQSSGVFSGASLANVPVSSINPQQVRDAMKLAPSAGAADANSIDSKISAIPTNPLGATAPTGWIDANAIASNAITAAKIADDSITAAKIATDAIDSDAIAATAVSEIQSGLSTFNPATTGVNVIKVAGTDVSGAFDPSVDSVVVGTVSTNAIAGTSFAASAKQAIVDSMLLGVTNGTTAVNAAPSTSPIGLSVSSLNNQTVINTNILAVGSELALIEGSGFTTVNHSLVAIQANVIAAKNAAAAGL